MPITEVTAYKDSWGNTHERLLDAHIEEVMGVYYGERPPSDEVIDSNCQNDLTRWAAEGVVKKLSRIVEAVFGEGAQIIVPEQIEEMQQVMTETQPSHEVRMQKALSALGFDYGDCENMPDSYQNMKAANMKAAEVIRSFYLIHVDGVTLLPQANWSTEQQKAYTAGVLAAFAHVKERVEADLEDLGSKL